mgnify:CR=1 FL=1
MVLVIILNLPLYINYILKYVCSYSLIDINETIPKKFKSQCYITSQTTYKEQHCSSRNLSIALKHTKHITVKPLDHDVYFI